MCDCLFCKIAGGEIPSSKVYEDDQVLAFRDIAPQAPVHVLVIPKCHIPNAASVTPENSAAVAHCFEVMGGIAQELELGEGFRVVSNCGGFAGQTVNHLHFHILGGRQLELTMG